MAGIADVIKLSALILGIVAKKDTDSDAERKWKTSMIPQWKELARKLMDIPMNPEVKAQTHKNKIRSDWFSHYGQMPKDRWVDKLHSEIIIALKGDLAVAGLTGGKK